MSEQVPTTCMRCAVGCGHVQQGASIGHGVDAVRGDPAHPVNRGLACRRGTSESADPDGEWLTRPMVRRGGALVPTTWDVALGAVIARFRAIAERDPNGVAVLGSGQQTNEAAYALGKVARGGIGTRNYDANTTLCMASAVRAYYDAFGSDAPPPTYDDVPLADVHVVWGANPAVAHPVLFRWIEDGAADADLVVVDPVETRTAARADLHVRPAPGADLALARAVLAAAVERDGIDGAFLREATTGFEALRARLPTVEAGAAAAGVPAGTVRRLAALLDRRTLLYWGMGVNQSANGTATARALIDLCLATGNLGPGSGPFSLTGQANSMGTRVCSSKGTWPGHRPFDDPAARAAVAATWEVPEARLPDDAGPGPVGIVERVGGEVEAVWTVATNPVASLPDADRAAARLDEAFLVVQDAFRTETVEHADVVLPAATWGESSGTVMNMERTVSRVRPATGTPSGVRNDLDLIATIGDGIAPGLFPDAPPSAAATFAEFAALTAGTNADCSGITYERLDAERAVRWPAPDADSVGGYRYRDDGGWSFPTADGLARFGARVAADLAEPTDEAYPLTLTTARTAEAYNTGVRSRGGPGAGGVLVARVHPATVERHRSESERGGDGATATLQSRRGAVPARLVPDEGVPEGVVWVPIHHPLANRLTLPAVDPLSREPNYKQCAVRLVAPEQSRGVGLPEVS
ncbi:assimilatory nitrate reductase NasA [Halomarina halobia]|uniref:Assimilatory nitrate reductase NasA n=1 Tax=Halomarina halobia TaxID=3033386 RepID=A0ABD6A9N6_9EURY|nr:assimilatory nitrate reductase NasA [Halomarina sp. PSR21]